MSFAYPTPPTYIICFLIKIKINYSIFAYYEHVRALIEIFAYKILQLWIFRPLSSEISTPTLSYRCSERGETSKTARTREGSPCFRETRRKGGKVCKKNSTILRF